MLLSSLLLLAAVAGAPDEPCLAVPKDVVPNSQAPNRPWYINGDPITFQGKSYTKYGLPRVLLPGDVTFGALYEGVPIGVDPSATDHEVIYLFVRSVGGCEFQPYQRDS